MKKNSVNKRKDYIPLSVPEIGKEEITNVVNCIQSGWLSTGKLNFKFEELLKKYIGAKEIICLDSCTSALHLSLKALGIGKGDEVITTSLTFAATANVIVHCGARVVFCDIDPYTYNIDPELIKEKITKRTKAIIPVHFAGHPCELEQIYNIADKYGLQVIEDAAHALGSSINGKKIGSFSGISCFSFYATKPITTGEGGCVALQDNKLAEKIRLLRFHGISRDSWKRYMKGGKWRYDIIEAGYKNNMTDVLAAIGIAQIKKIERFWKKRQSIAKKYSLALKNCPGLTTPFVKEGIKHSWHLYVCRVNKKEFGLSREQFIAVMDKAGIGTSVHYIPVHLHSYYRKNYGYNNGQFPVTERIGREVVSLPLYSKMSEIDVERVIQAIRDIKKGAKK